MPSEYPLLFDHEVYADMTRHGYDAARWMQMDQVRAKSTELSRSNRTLKSLCQGGVMRIGDMLTIRKDVGNGVPVSITATIAEWDHDLLPKMRTLGQSNNNLWRCTGPTDIVKELVQAHPNLTISSINVWELVSVTRDDKDLGSLQEIRQCFELWESEMEKWGCNGLGEQLSQGKRPKSSPKWSYVLDP